MFWHPANMPRLRRAWVHLHRGTSTPKSCALVVASTKGLLKRYSCGKNQTSGASNGLWVPTGSSRKERGTLLQNPDVTQPWGGVRLSQQNGQRRAAPPNVRFTHHLLGEEKKGRIRNAQRPIRPQCCPDRQVPEVRFAKGISQDQRCCPSVSLGAFLEYKKGKCPRWGTRVHLYQMPLSVGDKAHRKDCGRWDVTFTP